MSKRKSSPMTGEAASRISSATATKNGGNIPPKSFASRADATVPRAQASPVSAVTERPADQAAWPSLSLGLATVNGLLPYSSDLPVPRQ
ncbi:hypothetical protein G6F32_014933 [Rhizopus arrhizus]|nr:hypothetical protein G6F32_014933 [Rhizopus arrhizus]